MPRTLLIDGDIVVYRYSSIVEHEVDWGDDVWSLWADAKEAKQLILQYLEILKDMTEADDFIVCFSDKDNFRKTVYPDYKHNRKGKRKPVCYKACLEWMESEFKSCTMPTLEGDDVMGILATSGKYDDPVIVSEDKDMKTVPCLLWRGGEMSRVSEKDADYYHLYQTLVGDTTDGYGGLRGTGDKRATQLLKDEGATWNTVVKAYEKAGYTEEDALVQARLARILRHTDYDHKKKEPILWTP